MRLPKPGLTAKEALRIPIYQAKRAKMMDLLHAHPGFKSKSQIYIRDFADTLLEAVGVNPWDPELTDGTEATTLGEPH